MIKVAKRVFLSDFTTHLLNLKFWLIDAGLMIAVGMFVSLSWPADSRFGFERPFVGEVFLYVLLISVVIINLNLKNVIVKFDQVLTVARWSYKCKCDSLPVILGKQISVLAQNFILVLTAVPLAVLVYLAGAISPTALIYGMLKVMILGMVFGWIGIFLQNRLHKSLKFVNILVLIIFLTSLLAHKEAESGFRLCSYFIVNYSVMALIMLTDLKFNFVKLIFRE